MKNIKLDKLVYTTEIKLTGIPKQWIPTFELYYPDLPQFPIVYFHINNNGSRIYGCPVMASFEISGESNCNAKITLLSNVDLSKNLGHKEMVKAELEEHFGLSNKIAQKDLLECCNDDKDYELFFKDLWQYVRSSFGNYIPFGKFYDEVYSIIRFVSAWQPKTGRQSEMRMLYNFLSEFGEEIEICPEWNHLEFYLLPNYDDLLGTIPPQFNRFERLMRTVSKVWKIYYTNTRDCMGKEINSMTKSWPQAKDKFINQVTTPLLESGEIDEEDKYLLERLVDAFNRHSWRAVFFIWSIMSIKSLNYRDWDKSFFMEFYLNRNGVGISEKVVACFVQQGFKNEEVIPVDTWIETFHTAVLGIKEKKVFFSRFSSLEKLERIIWAASQANKTNMRSFFDMLWCQRYGVTRNSQFRMSNPIACYECRLRKTCVGYKTIKDLNVYSIDYGKITGEIGIIITDVSVTELANQKDCHSFACPT